MIQKSNILSQLGGAALMTISGKSQNLHIEWLRVHSFPSQSITKKPFRRQEFTLIQGRLENNLDAEKRP